MLLTRTWTAILGTPLVAAVALFALAAPADASKRCERVTLKVSKHKVREGGWVRVRGGTCRDRAHRPRSVLINVRGKRGWRMLGRARTRANGRFSKRVRVDAPGQRRVTRVRAEARRAESRPVRVRIAAISGARRCPLRNPGFRPDLTLNGCRVLASDTVSDPDPLGFWGDVDCETSSRHRVVSGGGDDHATATGADQGNSSYRRLTVLDGDNIWGERCELGLNERNRGATDFYREGQRRVTYISLRLPQAFPLATHDWQTVMQMKQANPANGGSGQPILEMQAHYSSWRVASNNGTIEHYFPAQRGVWTRFVWDVFYSADARRGWFQVSADLNGDGDIDDADERSPRYHAATLKRETGGSIVSGLAPGAPIPSHLRAGIYHDPGIGCPPPVGCTTEVDNVQVLAS